MANTYTQIHIQAVFAVKHREGLILPEFRKELFGYIGQTINELGHKNIIVNGVSDHVHCFFGFRPTQSLSDMMREVKSNASNWVNRQEAMKHRFEWQEGYGAFSYSKSQVDVVYKYIENQEEHHKTRSFREEYEDMLEKFGVEYDKQYIFKELI
jgi:putative transposase